MGACARQRDGRRGGRVGLTGPTGGPASMTLVRRCAGLRRSSATIDTMGGIVPPGRRGRPPVAATARLTRHLLAEGGDEPVGQPTRGARTGTSGTKRTRRATPIRGGDAAIGASANGVRAIARRPGGRRRADGRASIDRWRRWYRACARLGNFVRDFIGEVLIEYSTWGWNRDACSIRGASTVCPGGATPDVGRV